MHLKTASFPRKNEISCRKNVIRRIIGRGRKPTGEEKKE